MSSNPSLFIRSIRAFVPALLGTVLVMVSAIPAQAQAGAPEPQRSAARKDLRSGPTAPAEWDRLQGKARAEGQIPLIVGLDVPAEAEGDLADDARNAQRSNIARSRAGLLRELRGTNHSRVQGFDEVPYLSLLAGSDALAKLQRSPLVAGVDEDVAADLGDESSAAPAASESATPASAGSPQGTSSNTNISNYWNLTQSGATTAINNGYNGSGTAVAVLDTGVQRDHPALSGRVLSEACFSWLGGSSNAGGCPNGTHTQYGTGTARPCTFNVGRCAHGTHVAGTAAGTGTGVAPQAKVIGVQVFHRESSTNLPKSNQSDQLKGLQHVYNLRSTYRIAAANLSIGGGRSYNYCDERTSTSSFYAWAATLQSVGIATVVSSGNDGYSDSISSPACNSNVISVGNSTLDSSSRDAVYVGSNSYRYLNLLAPGTQICSSIPGSTYQCGWTGTSMAAPHVAGALAAIKQLEPGTTSAWVTNSLSALRNGGTAVYDSRNAVSVPRIHVWNALIWAYNH